MRRPRKHVSKAGQTSFTVRFRTDEGTETSLTFRAANKSAAGIKAALDDADQFSKMIDVLGVKGALEWERRNEGNPEEREYGPTLDEWAERYIETRTGVTDGTRHNYRSTYRLTYGEPLGAMRLGELGRDDIAKALNHLATSGRRDGTGSATSPSPTLTYS